MIRFVIGIVFCTGMMVVTANAQNGENESEEETAAVISGIVTDGESGDPLPGEGVEGNYQLARRYQTYNAQK